LVGAGVERAQVAGAGKMEGFGVQTRRDGKWDGRISGRTAGAEDENERLSGKRKSTAGWGQPRRGGPTSLRGLGARSGFGPEPA
jgi:hypothetical protein